MKFKKIDWKNIFAYGEELQSIEYIDGELVLLKGISGSGKSAVLSLPSLALYGKLEKLSKSSVANRTNKHGWIRCEIEKGGHTYIIERSFSPNDLQVYKDGENINSYGVSSAQDYIDNEIADIPIKTFSNMISISMKKFKSFLTMSPADRKEIIDRVFNLEVINIACENIKKDARSVGNNINSNKTTLFQLSQTLQNATIELSKIRQNEQSEEDKAQIQININKIATDNENITKLTEEYSKYSVKQQESTTEINNIKKQQYENSFNINTIQEKINLFSQDKCPTCGTHFDGEAYQNLLGQLKDLMEQKKNINIQLNEQLNTVSTNYNAIVEYLNKIQNAVFQLKQDIITLQSNNKIIEEKLNKSAEYQGIKNIIDSTTEQIETIKVQLANDTEKLNDLQKLAIVYSIDGVKQKVIINYLPILNKEIEHNLDLLNFPYQVEIDSKFDPHLKELGVELAPETLSDGEETRVDLVILCSLFKLLKRRFPSINILSIDEVISSLDNETSGLVLEFLKTFAKENNLSCFIVSHTDLYLDNFDKIINVEKKGFSHITVSIPNM